MRNMLRFTAALTVSLCFGLAACGGGGSNSTTPPPPATLTSITVTGNSTSVVAGLTLPLKATGNYSDSTTKDLTATATWASDNDAVATVAAGVVTAKSAGPAKITATASGGVSGSMNITVNAAALSSIAITSTRIAIPKGDTQQLVATGTYTNNTTADISNSVTWASSNPNAVTVDATGLATAKVATGTSDITASSGGTVTSPKITLSTADPAPKSLAILPATPNIATYQWVQPSAYLTYTDGTVQDVTPSSPFTVDSSAIVTLTSPNLGTVFGKSPGTTKLHATYNNLPAVTDVTVAGALNMLTIAPLNTTVHQNGEALFTATGTFTNGVTQAPLKFVNWSSSSTSVADFTSGGFVRGITAGNTTIHATLGGEVEQTAANLTVDNFALQSWEITPVSLNFYTPGNPLDMVRNVTVPLIVQATFSDGTTQQQLQLKNVTWASSDETVAVVSSTGVLRSFHIPNNGTTTITATLPNGDSKTLTVNVAPGTMVRLDVTSDNATPKVGDSVHFKAVAVLDDGREFEATSVAIWQSSDGSVGLIDVNGTFRALKAGAIKIYTIFDTVTTTDVTVAP